ncbi:MAG: ABC transporter permease [Chitinophagales bacterium]
MKQTLITSEPVGLSGSLKKIWDYRALILTFAQRDLKVKYAQTILGIGWSILQPLTALLIFAFFFGYILKWDAEGLPYSLYVLSGLLGWNFFSYIVYQGTASIQESAMLIKKIYFPKAVLPFSKIYIALVELVISFLLFIPLLLWHQQIVSWKIVFIPLVLFFNTLAALFLVFISTALAYRKRDILHVVPFLMYFGIWVTPVFFTKQTLSGTLQLIWYLNPMAAVTEAWRWCLFPQWEFDLYFLPGLLVLIPLFLFGFWLFIKNERKFSDYI